ncbi:unnamed protein product [Rotaria sp. Silwood2]|nr:unnamed protein product [Rotaria sp. Silwood2]
MYSSSCIENFSNEIFYEIFDYLDGYDIYKAFSNLNIRLENLLINSSLLMKIQIPSNTIFNFHYNQFLKLNKHHIISFGFHSEYILDKFMNFFIIDSLFSRLERLVFYSISVHKLIIVLFYLKSLPYLSSLSICINNCSHNLGDIYQMIFHLSLKYFRIAVPRYPHLCITIPITAQNQFSETWIDFQEHLHVNQNSKNNINDSSNPYFSLVELNVVGTFITRIEESIIDKINPILITTQITYLDIECDRMAVIILIKILHTLTNLNSIRLSNSPFCENLVSFLNV